MPLPVAAYFTEADPEEQAAIAQFASQGQAFIADVPSSSTTTPKVDRKSK